MQWGLMGLAERISGFLNIGEAPRPADCIFVLAGRQERKVYGVDLWRKGLAPELILSVGRFEWRRFYGLDLPGDGGLLKLVEATPPVRRHFFVKFGPKGEEAVLTPVRRLGTMTEARELAKYLDGQGLRSMMVVSTSIHLRRVSLAFRRAFKGSGLELSFVAVPESLSKPPLPLYQELIKYIGYYLLSYYK